MLVSSCRESGTTERLKKGSTLREERKARPASLPSSTRGDKARTRCTQAAVQEGPEGVRSGALL